MERRRSADFSIAALFAALDAERRARAMSWQDVARDIGKRFQSCSRKPTSPSTLSALHAKAFVEGDGVLHMLQWLQRTPESFVPGLADANAEEFALRAPPDRILRFDAKAMHVALDAQRRARDMTWHQLATEIGGVSVAVLTHLAKGGRVGFPSVMRIVGWLGRPAATFTRATDW